LPPTFTAQQRRKFFYDLRHYFWDDPHLFALPNTPENPFASIYSETLIKTTSQHLLLLVGFNTLIYRKYYDTPPILVGHQDYFLAPLPGSVALLKSGFGKGNRRYEYCFYFCLLF
jgi:hypothetical protein